MEIDRILAGDRRALARWLTALEAERPEAQAILSALYPRTGNAHLVGVTGAPGHNAAREVLKDYHRGRLRH